MNLYDENDKYATMYDIIEWWTERFKNPDSREFKVKELMEDIAKDRGRGA